MFIRHLGEDNPTLVRSTQSAGDVIYTRSWGSEGRLSFELIASLFVFLTLIDGNTASRLCIVFYLF